MMTSTKTKEEKRKITVKVWKAHTDGKQGPHLLTRVGVATRRRRVARHLLDVFFVVKYFYLTTSRFVLNVVHWSNFTLCFEFQFLIFNLFQKVSVQNVSVIIKAYLNKRGVPHERKGCFKLKKILQNLRENVIWK